MLNLTSTTEWKARIAEHFHGRADILAELEDHLLQEIEQLTRAGHSLDEATHMAISRFGAMDEIRKEFAKVPVATAWLPAKIVWILAGLLGAATLWPMLPKLSVGGTTTLMATHMAAVMLGYSASLLTGVLASCYLIGRIFQEPPVGQRVTLKQTARVFSTVALLLTACGMALSYWCPQAKTGPVFGWEIHEAAGVLILFWNCYLTLRCWSSSFQPVTIMSQMLVGSLLVTFGWFATTFSGSHGSVSGNVWMFGLLMAFQAAVACSAFIPVQIPNADEVS